jgi:cytochrome c biogenesis protein CcmG/thiol:disulfide interchange protein DsbE
MIVLFEYQNSDNCSVVSGGRSVNSNNAVVDAQFCACTGKPSNLLIIASYPQISVCISMSKPVTLPDASRRTVLRGSLGLGVAIFGAMVARPSWANDLKLGKLAPPLVLHTVDGRNIATRDLIGQVVIVTFWASWCGPCREELPLLSDYAARHAKDGLQVLGFCLDDADNVKQVREVAATLSFPVGILGSAYAGGYGRIWRMPVSFVIDRNGHLVDNGWDDPQPIWTAERLQRVMDPLLT